MRQIVFLILLVLSFKSQAYTCPSYVKAVPNALDALNFVKKWEGQFRVGGCQVEIITCDGWADVSAMIPLAEILIIDDKGRQVYATLAYPREESAYFFTNTKLGKRVLHFERTDKMFEDEFGRTEVVRLEFVADWSNSQKLSRIELGTYSTNKQLNHNNGNDSEWFICQDSE